MIEGIIVGPMIDKGKKRQTTSPRTAESFVQSIFVEDVHAKRVLSLANAVTGVIAAGALGIHAIGRGLASAKGLVERHAVRRPAATPTATATATASTATVATATATEHPAQAAAPPPPPPPAELWWRVRVKDCDGNRTRVVAIVAASREEAIAATLAEIGGGWEILEAEIAPRAPTTKKVSSQNT